jgi:hypothetical protein
MLPNKQKTAMPTETAASKIMLFRTRMSLTQLTTGAYCRENGFAVLKDSILRHRAHARETWRSDPSSV